MQRHPGLFSRQQLHSEKGCPARRPSRDPPAPRLAQSAPLATGGDTEPEYVDAAASLCPPDARFVAYEGRARSWKAAVMATKESVAHGHRAFRVATDQDESGASTEAIERLYAEQLGRFRRLARALVGDSELARDVVQKAFAAAVRGRRSFRGEGDLEGWLWRLVVNSALGGRRG